MLLPAPAAASAASADTPFDRPPPPGLVRRARRLLPLPLAWGREPGDPSGVVGVWASRKCRGGDREWGDGVCAGKGPLPPPPPKLPTRLTSPERGGVRIPANSPQR